MGETVRMVPPLSTLLVQFWVPGEPRSKARPRFARGPNDSVSTYTPEETKEGEQAIAWAAVAAQPLMEPVSGPVAIDAVFYLYRRNRRDIDNMIKCVLDGLNEVAYLDDQQVVRVSAVKRRAEKGEEGTMVEVYALPDDSDYWPIVPKKDRQQSAKPKSPGKQSAKPKSPGRATVSDQTKAADVSPRLQAKIRKMVNEQGAAPDAVAAFLQLPVGTINTIIARTEDGS